MGEGYHHLCLLSLISQSRQKQQRTPSSPEYRGPGLDTTQAFPHGKLSTYIRCTKEIMERKLGAKTVILAFRKQRLEDPHKF